MAIIPRVEISTRRVRGGIPDARSFSGGGDVRGRGGAALGMLGAASDLVGAYRGAQDSKLRADYILGRRAEAAAERAENDRLRAEARVERERERLEREAARAARLEEQRIAAERRRVDREAQAAVDQADNFIRNAAFGSLVIGPDGKAERVRGALDRTWREYDADKTDPFRVFGGVVEDMRRQPFCRDMPPEVRETFERKMRYRLDAFGRSVYAANARLNEQRIMDRRRDHERKLNEDLQSATQAPTPVFAAEANRNALGKIKMAYGSLIENPEVLDDPRATLADVRLKGAEGRAWGTRRDGTAKGPGWLGPKQTAGGGVATEYSVGVEFDGREVEIPTLVPTLTGEELDTMLNDVIPNGKQVPDAIMKKAVDHAKKQMAEGKPVWRDADPAYAKMQDDYNGLMRENLANRIDNLTAAAANDSGLGNVPPDRLLLEAEGTLEQMQSLGLVDGVRSRKIIDRINGARERMEAERARKRDAEYSRMAAALDERQFRISPVTLPDGSVDAEAALAERFDENGLRRELDGLVAAGAITAAHATALFGKYQRMHGNQLKLRDALSPRREGKWPGASDPSEYVDLSKRLMTARADGSDPRDIMASVERAAEEGRLSRRDYLKLWGDAYGKMSESRERAKGIVLDFFFGVDRMTTGTLLDEKRRGSPSWERARDALAGGGNPKYGMDGRIDPAYTMDDVIAADEAVGKYLDAHPGDLEGAKEMLRRMDEPIAKKARVRSFRERWRAMMLRKTWNVNSAFAGDGEGE